MWRADLGEGSPRACTGCWPRSACRRFDCTTCATPPPRSCSRAAFTPASSGPARALHHRPHAGRVWPHAAESTEKSRRSNGRAARRRSLEAIHHGCGDQDRAPAYRACPGRHRWRAGHRRHTHQRGIRCSIPTGTPPVTVLRAWFALARGRAPQPYLCLRVRTATRVLRSAPRRRSRRGRRVRCRPSRRRGLGACETRRRDARRLTSRRRTQRACCLK
jgi:hypothetical protein